MCVQGLVDCVGVVSTAASQVQVLHTMAHPSRTMQELLQAQTRPWH